MGEGGLVDSDAELRTTRFIGVDYEDIVVPSAREITVQLSGMQVRAWYI